MIRVFTLAILAAVLLSQAAVNAFAQERGPTKEEIMDANYSGPIVQDAFWTDRTTPPPANVTSWRSLREDGASVLAVVLCQQGLVRDNVRNRDAQAPTGFRASQAQPQAVATHDAIVEPGATFTLFFEA